MARAMVAALAFALAACGSEPAPYVPEPGSFMAELVGHDAMPATPTAQPYLGRLRARREAAGRRGTARRNAGVGRRDGALRAVLRPPLHVWRSPEGLLWEWQEGKTYIFGAPADLEKRLTDWSAGKSARR